MEIEWKRRLHDGGQVEVFHDSRRFKVLACGTRWGKTRLCANAVIDKGLKRRMDIWWVAPTYELGERGLTALFNSGPRELFGKENKVKKVLPMISGTTIQFKTAENPVSLLGKGIDFLIVDEAARIKDEIWFRYLRRTLIDHRGEAIFISTPRGKNWFYQLWLKGRDSFQDEYRSWKFSTFANPLLSSEELQKVQDDIPSLIFRQEYLAEFVEEANQVFRNIGQCVAGELEEPRAGESYTMGVDLAKYRDFTVLTVMNQDGHVVFWDRFNQLDWGFQKTRIKSVAKRYGARVVIDSTGLGDPIFDDLQAAGVNVGGIRFTEQTKRQLIENLSILLEQRQITFPKIDQVIHELESFECAVKSSGLRYSAPSGMTDDAVISLALAAWGVKRICQPNIRVIG